jgi:hypothetical protein
VWDSDSLPLPLHAGTARGAGGTECRINRGLEKHLLPDRGEKVLSKLPFVNDCGLVYRSFAAI